MARKKPKPKARSVPKEEDFVLLSGGRAQLREMVLVIPGPDYRAVENDDTSVDLYDRAKNLVVRQPNFLADNGVQDRQAALTERHERRQQEASDRAAESVNVNLKEI